MDVQDMYSDLQPSSTVTTDDESFVVLGRSLPPGEDVKALSKSMQKSTISNASSQNVSTLINATSRTLKSSVNGAFTAIPVMPSLAKQHPGMGMSEYSMQSSCPTSELSPDEIQKKLTAVLQENMELKDVLNQNNLAMRAQFDKIVKWQQEVQTVHSTHKEKFDETKQFICNLRSENAALKQKLTVNESVEAENTALKSKIQLLESQINGGEADSDGGEHKWNELVDQLTKQLQLVERSRREEILNHQREQEAYRSELKICKEQLLAAQMKITEYESRRESLRSLSSSSLEQISITKNESLVEKAKAYDAHIRNLRGFFDQQKRRYAMLQTSISVATNLISSGAPAESLTVIIERLKEEVANDSDLQKFIPAQNNFKQIFDDYQNLLSELQNMRQELDGALTDLSVSNRKMITLHRECAANEVKFTQLQMVNADVSEELKKARADIVRCQTTDTMSNAENTRLNEEVNVLNNEIIIKDNFLQHKTDQIKELQKKVDQLRLENESIEILKAQVEVYQSDFNTERASRQILMQEKDRIAEDLRLLQRRNQQLIEQIEKQSTGWPLKMPPPTPSASGTVRNPTALQQSNPYRYECPKCQFKFNSYDTLEQHVNLCLDDMIP